MRCGEVTRIGLLAAAPVEPLHQGLAKNGRSGIVGPLTHPLHQKTTAIKSHTTSWWPEGVND